MNKSLRAAAAAAVGIGFMFTPGVGALLSAPAAHADTECGNVRPGIRVTAGEDTSCDFALNVAGAMMNGHGDGTQFLVHSPTTNEDYWMSCSIEGHGSTTCRGGNNAVVRIY
jgi:hypothetical protein